MSAKPQPKRMTVAEYLAHERAATCKSDFIDGRLYPVHDPYHGWPKTTEDGSLHTALKANLLRSLSEQLRAAGGDAFVSGALVRVAPNVVGVVPDLVLAGARPEWDHTTDTLMNPQVVIEIVSDDTVRRDCVDRLAAYKATPSIREVVYVWDRDQSLQVFARREGPVWSVRFGDDMEPELALETLPLKVALADVYQGIDLTPYFPPGWLDPQ